MYDYLVVGSGFFGSTAARLLSDLGMLCLVIDKNPYVGGMASDTVAHGQIIGLHGAHIFHTNSEEVWRFINQFSIIEPFINKPKVMSLGDLGDRFRLKRIAKHVR